MRRNASIGARAWAVVLAGVLAASAQSAQARTLQLSDLRGIVRVSTPWISPDGQRIAVVVSKRDFDKDRADQELMLVDARTGGVRPLTYDRIHIGEVRWAPDGKSIGFIATSGTDDDAQSQVFIMPLAGGDPHAVTTAKNGVDEFAWRPDSKALAFVADDDAPNKAQIDKHLDAFEVGHNSYLATSVPPSSQLWTVPAAGGTSKKLTRGAWQLSDLAWSPDARSVAATVAHSLYSGDADQTSIAVFDAKSGTMRALSDRTQLEQTPLYSPDGTKIAYTLVPGASVANEAQVYVSPAGGGKGIEISRSIDRELTPFAWTPDGRSVLAVGNDGVTTSMWIVGTDGAVRKAPLGEVAMSFGSISRTGAMAISGGEPHRPAEVYYLTSPDAKPRRLTNFNAKIASLDLGAVRPVAWTSDAFAENGVLTLPPKGASATSKPPLVVLIHGGPTSTSTMSFDSGYGGLAQLFAARGWAVFQPNYRGSDNLGARYMEATIGDLGAGPGRDIVAGVRSLERAGVVDPNRVAVGGWSEGGCLTAWLITHYTMWRAAMAGAAVTDWIAEYNLSDAVFYEKAIAGGSPWVGDGWDKLAAESAIGAAANVRTPTLIMSDTGDYRVPTPEEYAFYHALRDNGVEVQYVAFPFQGHFPSDPVRSEEIFKRWIAWYDTHL